MEQRGLGKAQQKSYQGEITLDESLQEHRTHGWTFLPHLSGGQWNIKVQQELSKQHNCT